jgi:hypothetical protein
MTNFSVKMPVFAMQPPVFQEYIRVSKAKNLQRWQVIKTIPDCLHIPAYNKGAHPQGWQSESNFSRS